MRSLPIILTVLVGCAGLALSAAAEQQPFLGAFGDWEAFAEGEGNKRLCYITSIPKKHQGKYKSRGNMQAFVTHEPGAKIRGQVSFAAGYAHKKGSDVDVRIGKGKFSLFTQNDRAWPRDGKGDRAIVQAMRRGSTMVVRGVSTRGTKTTDTYSLKGFTAAYNAINKACKVK